MLALAAHQDRAHAGVGIDRAPDIARSRCIASVAEFCRPSLAMITSSTPSDGTAKARLAKSPR